MVRKLDELNHFLKFMNEVILTKWSRFLFSSSGHLVQTLFIARLHLQQVTHA